jgi:hypothetical protein
VRAGARATNIPDASWRLQKRGWQIFLLAHVFRLQSFLLNPGATWASLLKPDILNILGLIQEGLLDRPTLYLSRYILGTRATYYRLLGRVTSEQEWEPWILYMLTAVEETSRWTTQKIKAVHALMTETITYVRANSTKTPHAVVELIFKQPYARISNIVESKIVGREAASKYLKELVRLGVLVEEKKGRDKIFLHRKYLDVLFSEEHTFEPYARTTVAATPKRRARVGA